jgi:Mce-associated membrane protein
VKHIFARRANDESATATADQGAEAATSDPVADDGAAEVSTGERSEQPLSATDDSEPAPDSHRDDSAEENSKLQRRIMRSPIMAYGLLPGLALLMAVAAGYLSWQNATARDARVARVESVSAAKEATVALLSYRPDSAQKDLERAQERMTGAFKESYTRLIHDVVIPGAAQQHISSTATVPAASSISATSRHAVALLFVDQTTVVGTDTPSDASSSVQVTLDKVDNRWLISAFDPV